MLLVPPSMVNAAPVMKSVVGLTRWLTRSVRSFLEILFHRIPVEQIPVSIDDRAQRTDLACSRKFYFVVGNIDLNKLNLGTGSVPPERQNDRRLEIGDVARVQRHVPSECLPGQDDHLGRDEIQ